MAEVPQKPDTDNAIPSSLMESTLGGEEFYNCNQNLPNIAFLKKKRQNFVQNNFCKKFHGSRIFSFFKNYWDDATLEIRFLISSRHAGGIIGKNGSYINKIRDRAEVDFHVHVPNIWTPPHIPRLYPSYFTCFIEISSACLSWWSHLPHFHNIPTEKHIWKGNVIVAIKNVTSTWT